MENMIRVESVSKRFGNLVALDNLNLHVDEGELLGIIGPNGAGKTTAIRIICGVLHPDSGRVIVGGYDVKEDPIKVKSLIGYLPEEPNLYERFTARDLLRYFGELYGVPRNRLDNRIDELLEFVDMEKRADDPINTFSKGLRQRVAIARALIHDPPVIIFDEPTMGLDPATAFSIREFIMDLKGDKTMILCTHYMEEADYLCDRVAILNEGRILDIGTPEELKSKIESEFIIEVKVREPGLVKIDAIHEIGGVVDVSMRGSLLHITISEHQTIQKIIDILGDNIYSINTHETTLDDVFIEMIKGFLDGPLDNH